VRRPMSIAREVKLISAGTVDPDRIQDFRSIVRFHTTKIGTAPRHLTELEFSYRVIR